MLEANINCVNSRKIVAIAAEMPEVIVTEYGLFIP